jgi:hypothetical protein
VSEEFYSFKNSVLEISDPELNLSIRENFSPAILPEKLEDGKELGGGHSLSLSYIDKNKQQLDTAGILLNGFLSGNHRSFHLDGSVENDCYYYYDKESSSSLLHGPSTCYCENGSVLSKVWFFYGKQVGKARSYYPSGNLHSLHRYIDGVYHLKQEYYYDNTSLKTSMTFHKGKHHGECSLYYENGNMFRKIFYHMGNRHGLEKEWNEKGQKIASRLYEMNELKEELQWNSRNILIDERIFVEGTKRVNFKKWSKDGDLLIMGVHNKDRATLRSWYLDGKLELEFHGYWNGYKVCMDKLVTGNVSPEKAARYLSWNFIEEK